MEKIRRSIPITRPYKLPFESNKWGGAYFDGLNGSFISGNIAGDPITNQVSEFCWVQYELLNVAQNYLFLGTAAGSKFVPYIGGNNDLVLYTSNGSVNSNIKGTKKLFFNGYTYDGVTSKIYIDGVLKNQLNNVVSLTQNNYTVGSDTFGFTPSNIKMSEVFIVEGALTQPQIQDLMYGRILPTQFDCRLWHDYRLGHARDLSGNNNHGTLTGNVRFV